MLQGHPSLELELLQQGVVVMKESQASSILCACNTDIPRARIVASKRIAIVVYVKLDANCPEIIIKFGMVCVIFPINRKQNRITYTNSSRCILVNKIFFLFKKPISKYDLFFLCRSSFLQILPPPSFYFLVI